MHIYTQSITLNETHRKAVIATSCFITITDAHPSLNLLEPPPTLKQIILFISASPTTLSLSMPYESLSFPRFQYIYIYIYIFKKRRWDSAFDPSTNVNPNSMNYECYYYHLFGFQACHKSLWFSCLPQLLWFS